MIGTSSLLYLRTRYTVTCRVLRVPVVVLLLFFCFFDIVAASPEFEYHSKTSVRGCAVNPIVVHNS